MGTRHTSTDDHRTRPPSGAAAGRDVVSATIDRSLKFLCPSVCPLWFTPIWADLDAVHHRRCTQLMAMYLNELIAYFEGTFVAAVLSAAQASTPWHDATRTSADGRIGRGDLDGHSMRRRLEAFAADERRHRATWLDLNRRSDPALYARTDAVLLHVPGWLGLLARLVAARPERIPLVYWLMLALEEHSMEISRRTLGLPLEELEPTYRAVHRAHLADEARHVQLDRELIRRRFSRASSRLRRWTGRVLGHVLGRYVVRPGASARRLVDRLVFEHPELVELRPVLHRQVRGVDRNPDYVSTIYSRQASPLFFAELDRWPEMAGVASALSTYRPAEAKAAKSSLREFIP